MDPRIAEWLASGDIGTSSKAIMLWLSSRTVDKTWGASTPSDVSDLGRCLRLLALIPEWRPRMSEMAEAGALWPTFAKRWDQIERLYLEETGGKILGQYEHASLPRTYKLMQAVHKEAYANDRPSFTEVRFDKGPLAGCTMRFGK